MSLDLTTRAEEETRALGGYIGRAAAAGDLIGLYGPLGAGKTSFVRGLAEGLGVSPERVRSPSFTLVVTYRGGRLPIYHIDLYRLDPTPDDRMAMREYLYGAGLCVVEWFDRFGESADHLAVEIAYVEGMETHERRIRLRACGDRYGRLVQAVEDLKQWR